MSKNARTKHQEQASSARSNLEGNTSQGPDFRPPLKPSRRRLAIAAGLLAIWLGFLLTLYVTAVSPEKQKKQSAVPEIPATQPGTISR